MPAPYPPEFRRRAVELARAGDKSIAQIAKDMHIAESGLRRWLAQAEIEEGLRPGMTAAERKELTELRRRNRQLELELEILKRAAAYFAKENVIPK